VKQLILVYSLLLAAGAAGMLLYALFWSVVLHGVVL
jgi:hypothetical protein